MSNENKLNEMNFEFPIKLVKVRKDETVYDWYVVSPFLDQAGADKPELDYLDAITKLNITRYTHNTQGPAIINPVNKYESYFLKGLPAKKEDVERLKYNADFADHVDKVINEE